MRRDEASQEPGASWVRLQPEFLPDEPPEASVGAEAFFLAICRWWSIMADASGSVSASDVRRVREVAVDRAPSRCPVAYQPVRLAISTVADLLTHGWHIRVSRREVWVRRPDPDADRSTERERVRRSLVLARDEQLASRPVRQFVRGMERRRPGPRGWASIHSLMRDGEALAAQLHEIATLVEPAERERRLGLAIRPYLQFVTDGARCEWTGLRLSDVWRYFRHTWLTPSRSTPGRNMMILVRDAAVEPHPVLGIAAISSSIAQLRVRDQWIGWQGAASLDANDPAGPATAEWAEATLERLIAGVRWVDLVDSGIVSRCEIAEPTREAIRRLQAYAAEQKKLHNQRATQLDYKRKQDADDWKVLVDTHLYRHKRASALADLLDIRSKLRTMELSSRPQAGHRAPVRAALARLVRHVKAAHMGINMMDISVAGALAPYNAILGGKLVSMLLTSPEVVAAYGQRYRDAASVIASGMKGEAVVRPPKLVLLCTTGLFGGGSSQYNRVRVPADAVGGNGGRVEFQRLRKTTAYSTHHLSQATLDDMRRFVDQWHQGSEVHGIFGEGVNPKMRKIREALDRLGLPADEILRPGSARAIYAVALAHNFADVLLGRTDTPEYILPQGEPAEVTRRIAEFWRCRWLAARIAVPGVLDSVARHRLTLPVEHGACVPLPPCEVEAAECPYAADFQESLTLLDD